MDLCCGTGDLSLWLSRLSKPETSIYALDYSQPMLDVAIAKAAKVHRGAAVAFVQGDVADLPFPDGYFDCIGISFAFRNLTYKNPMTQKYLSEIVRVLKPEGKFVIVESSQPPNRVIRKLHHLYLRWFVRRIGYLISKNRPAYAYLAESARNFYTAEELADLLVKAGFKEVSIKRLFFGACAIHIAMK